MSGLVAPCVQCNHRSDHVCVAEFQDNTTLLTHSFIRKDSIYVCKWLVEGCGVNPLQRDDVRQSFRNLSHNSIVK